MSSRESWEMIRSTSHLRYEALRVLSGLDCTEVSSILIELLFYCQCLVVTVTRTRSGPGRSVTGKMRPLRVISQRQRRELSDWSQTSVPGASPSAEGIPCLLWRGQSSRLYGRDKLPRPRPPCDGDRPFFRQRHLAGKLSNRTGCHVQRPRQQGSKMMT